MLRPLLLGAAVLGLALRIVASDPGNQGPLVWVGGIMLIVSICGLVVIQFLRERAARPGDHSFYFGPYWKYGLGVVGVVAALVQGATRTEGALSTVNAGLFWGAVIALIVRTVGRWVIGRRTQLE